MEHQLSTWQRQPYSGNLLPKYPQESDVCKPYECYSGTHFCRRQSARLEQLLWARSKQPRSYTETVRIDHNFSDRDQVFGRFSFGKSLQTQYEGTINQPVLLDGSSANIINIARARPQSRLFHRRTRSRRPSSVRLR